MGVSKEVFLAVLAISIFMFFSCGGIFLFSKLTMMPRFLSLLPFVRKALLNISSLIFILLVLLAFQHIHETAHKKAQRDNKNMG